MSHPILTATGSLLIFLVALKVINAELSKYTLQDLQIAIDQIGIWTILGAVIAAGVAYFALAFNDRFALSMLGKRLPHARTARASLAAYALANTLGYSWATAATARQRLYRKWGLLPAEIGALSFVTGTGVQVGGLAAAGLGLLIAAKEVALHGPLNWAFWFGVGLITLIPAGLWLYYAKRGPIKTGIAGSPLTRPTPRTALAHLSAIILDWIGAAAVLYILLPNHGGWSFPAFLAVYVLAGMLGAISGAPGGLGVFEAAILTLAPVSQDTPGAAIALVLYRLIYNVIPLAVAALILGLDHAAPAARPAARVAQQMGSRVGAGLSARLGRRLGISLNETALEFSPRILAALVFSAGLVLLASVATPSLTDRIKLLDQWDLHAISELSHFGASIVGVALLIVAAGLWKKVNTAWISAIGLLVAGIIFSLSKGVDWEEALVLGVVILVMLPCKRAFTRHSQLGSQILSPGWIAAIAGGVAASGWLALFAYQHVDFRTELWWEFVRDRDAARTLRALTGASVVTLHVAIWTLVRPLRAKHQKSNLGDIDKIAAILASAHSPRADSNLAFLGDKCFLFSDSGNSFVMYRPRGKRWIAYGEPIGLISERQELMVKLREASDQADARPVYYAVSRDCVADFAAFGYGVRKIGETAVVALISFDLVGKDAQDLRTSRNKMSREGVKFEVLDAAQTRALLPEMETVSRNWMRAQRGGEKTFSLGAFNHDYLARFPTAIARDSAGKMLAFANLWTTPDRAEVAIDLMRYSGDAPKGVMDFLFVEIALWAKQQGFNRFDLAMAPLSGLEDNKGAPFLVRLGAVMFEEGEEFYGFRGLRHFKDKFKPTWEPLYLCAPADVMLVTALFDVAVLTNGGLRGMLARP
jgi:phosphatidylglycerol lysyltransferase